MRSSRTISLAALSLLCYCCCLDSSRNSALGFLSSSKATRSIIVPSSNSVRQSNSNEHPQSHRRRRRRCRLPRPFSNHIVLHTASNDKDTPASGLPSSSSSSSSSSSQSSNTTISVAGATGTGDASASIEVPDTSALPSYRKLIVFTLTTILIWISEPLLSLVDTTIVGMTTTSAKSAVVQIAALGPATTLYDSSIYMTYFLAIAATNLISPALAKKDWKELRKSTSHLMGLAIVFGSIVSLVAFGLGKSLIANMVGTSFVNPEIIPLATNYARIRAAVAPFCVVDFVAQSFCLATLDTKTPAMAVAVASLVNIVGDLLLSPRWGIQGAAVATAMATVSSSLILVRKVRQQTKQWKILQETEEQDQYVFLQKSKTKTKTTIAEMTTENDSDDSSSSPRPLKTQVVNGSIEMVDDNQDRPFGAPKTKKINGAAAPKEIPFWSLPDKKSLVELMKLAGPIFFVMMGKIACYSIMTVRATTFGIIPLAAHNIMMRIFFFFACFGDSLSQATQTFFPQVKQEKRGQLIQRLLYLSAGVGFGISQCSYFILTKLGGFLTKDAAIIQQMAQYAPYVAGSVLLHPFIMLLEGTVLARRDLMYLVGMYITTMALHFGMVFLLPQSFGGLWQVFFTFQAIRLVQFAGRVAWKSSSSSRRGGGGGGAGGEPNQSSGDTAAAAVP